MIKLSLQNTWSHKRRLIGTFLAIMIGIGFLSGTLVLGDTLRDNFNKLFDAGFSGTDALVRPERAEDADLSVEGAASRTLEASLAEEILQIDGVRNAVWEVQTYGQLIGKDGEGIGGQGPPTFAGRWITDSGISPFDLIEGRAPEGTEEVVIDSDSAEVGKLKVGDTTTLLLPDPLEVTIVGIARFGEDGNPNSVTWAYFSDGGTAEHLVKTPGRATDILVAAEDGVTQAELVERLQPVLPDGVEAITGEAAADEAVDDLNAAFLSFLTSFLVVFAGIALLVATFSIYNTFSILVAQRSQEAALMRAIGATRSQVLTSTMVEALVIGVLASIAGLIAGLGFASGLKALFAAFDFNLPAGGLTIKASGIIIALVVGVLVTLAAAIIPARRGSRVAPVEALRSSAVEADVPTRRRGIIGVVVAALGVGILVFAVTAKPDNELQIAGFAAVLCLLSMLVLGPVVARPVAGLIGWPAARLTGLTGELSRENAVRNPRRTASTAAALLVGVAVVVLFTVFIASAKNLVTQTVDKSFGGDLVIASQGFGGGTLPTSLADDVAAVDGVDQAIALGAGPMAVVSDGVSSNEFVTLAAVEALAGLLDLGIVDGDAAAVDAGSIGISEDHAEAEGLSLGDSVAVTFPDGVQEDLPVGMIYANADIAGKFLLARSTFLEHSEFTADAIVFVAVEPGASIDEVRDSLEDVTAAVGRPEIQDRGEFKESIAATLDALLGLVYLMLVLAIIIAVMGIANTLALSVFERTRELGVLRAVGTTKRQVRRMVRWESAIVSTFGTLGGVGLGAGLGWALVQAAFADSNENPFTLPVANLVIIVLVGVVVGIGAAALPALRASRTKILDAIASA